MHIWRRCSRISRADSISIFMACWNMVGMCRIAQCGAEGYEKPLRRIRKARLYLCDTFHTPHVRVGRLCRKLVVQFCRLEDQFLVRTKRDLFTEMFWVRLSRTGVPLPSKVAQKLCKDAYYEFHALVLYVRCATEIRYGDCKFGRVYSMRQKKLFKIATVAWRKYVRML